MTTVLLGVLSAIVIVYSFSDFRKAVLLFTVLLPFSGFLPGFEIKGLNLLTVMVAVLYLASARQTGQYFPASPLHKVLIILVSVTLLSWFLTTLSPPPPRLGYGKDPVWLSFRALVEIKRWIIFFPIYLIYVNALRDPKITREILIAAIVGIGLESLLVLKEYLLAGRARIYGSLSNPNELGAFAAAYLPLVVVYLFRAREMLKRIFYSAIGALTLFSLVYSQSRGAYLSFINSIAVFAFLRSKTLFAGIVLGGILAFTVSYQWLPDIVVQRIEFTFKQEEPQNNRWGSQQEGELTDKLEGSAASRLILAKTAFRVFADYPILGSGIGTFEYVMGRYARQVDPSFRDQVVAHNMYMQVLSELGLAGFIPFVAVFIISLRSGYKLYRTGKSDFARHIGLAFMCCVLAFMVANLFGNRFFRISLTGYFWTLAAAVFSELQAAGFPRTVPGGLEPATLERQDRTI